MELDHHIEQYFQRRYTNDEILAVLAEVHGVVLSKRKLERILREKILSQFIYFTMQRKLNMCNKDCIISLIYN